MKILKDIQQISSFLLFGLVLSAIVFGQNTDSKKYKDVYLINSYELFGKETKIREIVEIRQMIDVEFQPRNVEFEKLYEELKIKARELNSLLEEVRNAPKGICFAASFIKGIDERYKIVETLSEQVDKHRAETLALYKKRENELLNPLKEKIFDSLQQFAKENNYEVIVDLATLDTALASFPSVGDDWIDITNQFIEYYNTQFAEK